MTLSRIWVATALAAVAAVGCSDGTSPDKTYFGPSITMGNGTARSYVVLTADGVPVSVGVSLSETALTGLPSVGTAYVFALPSEAPVAPYKHAVINWSPTGHPPQGVFTVPHFDVHFYIITTEERVAILLTDAQFGAKTARLPSAEFVPSGYVNDRFAIPQMGVHWTDPSSPAFTGQPFTKEFIYGSWDGAFTFYEPMMAKSLLDAKPAMSVTPIKLPSRYAKPGVYPTSYTIGYDSNAKEYRIEISGLR
ncbi:MAG: DUF5602 domain-containing protein [Gemmatimonadota bacterium]|nr:DUF5602 domain-containing protein [Gemmatimonadota bacterium]